MNGIKENEMRLRRAVIAGAVTVLTASLVQAATAPVAGAAGGPSVAPPEIAPTPVVAEVVAPREPDGATLAALSGNQGAVAEDDGAGLASAQPLSPTANWDVATHTGDFTWTYPMRVPPAPGGLVPELGLTYRSSAVDGRTSATNNQPSWVGEGWDLAPGFVERAYGACADDTAGGTTPPKNGDLCWRSDNATAVFPGGGGMLVRDDATGTWKSRTDDGARVERKAGAGNGDDDGEHWVITSVDGTQYWFGSSADAGSTWTVPVFGDDAGEPCHKAAFDAAHCTQAWRWNLDKVVDRNGNVIRYFYAPETNRYGMNLKDTAVSYTRGGTLERIEYGLRADVATPAARVLFAHAGRCVPGSGCVTTQHDNWPDVAWKAHCDTDLCAGKHTPTFWTTRRLASVTTEVRRGADFTPVDRWTFEHAFPNPGDGEKAALWLKAVKHTGLVGGTAELPPITFEGTALPNRVDTQTDGIAPLNRYRLTAVVSEAGGVTEVRYAGECRPGGPLPATSHENTLRCFPVRWAKRNFEERTDHFHKYVVESVLEYDRTASSRARQTRYEYLGGAAWHWDTGEFAPDDKKSWTEFRGFGRVRVRTGAADDRAGPVTMTEERYHRGMDGDRLPTGKRAVSVTDSEGGSRVDADWLAGFRFETATFEREAASDQPDPVRVGKTITEPAVHGPTATRGEYKAYIVRTGTTRTFTPVEGGVRKTASTTSYDEHGLPYRTDDQGDTATAADDLCTTTTYHRDTGKWLVALPATTRTVSVHCGATPVFPANAVSATRTTYDDFGNAVKSEVGDTWTDADPVHAVTATRGYDAHGRPTSVTDALGKTTTTAYTPAHGGPLTATTVTTPPTPAVPAGLVTTTTVDPAWGVPTLAVDPNGRTTEVRHDPLGRRVKVWLPNRPSADHPTPSVETTYQVRKDDLSAVTTTRIGPNGTGVTTTALHDGLLRHRQTQSPAFGGGRLLTDTRYDSHGRPWKTTQPYFAEGPVDTKLWTADDTAIPGHTRTLHDGAGRRVASVYFAGAFEKWRTTTAHGGDRVHVTPPDGGTATTTITDARGRVVELRQHRSATDFDTTRYTYTPAGGLETLTDPADAVWRYEYDLRGRRTKADDPDSGATTTAYDAAGRIAKVTDARASAVTYTYDALGRRTTASKGTAKFAEWTYDTATKGKGRLATTTRWTEGRAYKTGVSGYTSLYLPLSRSVTIPAEEGLLEGKYETFYGYEPDGSLSAESYPAAGELPEETVNHDYHDTGQPHTSTGGYNGETHRHVAGTTYTRYGEVERVELGSGTKRAWLTHYYDANTRRLNRTIVDAELPSPKLADTTYTRDDAGNITRLADGADVQCFRHDPLGRVTEAYTADCSSDPAVASLAGPAPYWHSYTYDKSGNRKTETHHAASGDVVRTYAYGVPGHAHAVGSVTTQGPGGTTSAAYEYLASGQTSARPGQRLTWDTEGRLASVVEGAKTTSFVYDADGNRLMRKEPGATTLYLGNQELRLGTSGPPTVTRYYSGGGRVVALRRGLGALTWLASDHQSTAQIAIASDTQQVTRRRHLPFGAPRGTDPTWPSDHGFVGGTKDASGLTHLGAREYDPVLGRFISVDPLMAMNDPQQLNGYTYSNNSPVTRSDPTGLVSHMCPDGDCSVGRKDPAPTQQCGVPYVCPGDRYTGADPAPTRSCERFGCWDTKPQSQVKNCNHPLLCQKIAPEPKKAPPPPLPLPVPVWVLFPDGKAHAAEGVLALCGGGSVQYATGNKGWEGCVAMDAKGYGWSTAEKHGLGNTHGKGADIGISGKIAQGDIEGLGGNGHWIAADVGKRGGVEIGQSDETGDLSFSAGVAAGVGDGSPVTAGTEEAKSGYIPGHNQQKHNAIWSAFTWLGYNQPSLAGRIGFWKAFGE